MTNRNERPILAILDSSRDFAWRLAEYMNAKSGFPFEACPFTEAESLLTFMETHPVEGLLLEEGFLDEAAGAQAARRASLCALLTEEEKSERSERSQRSGAGSDGDAGGLVADGTDTSAAGVGDTPYFTLYKYQSAQKLIDQVMIFFAERGGSSGQGGDLQGSGQRDISGQSGNWQGINGQGGSWQNGNRQGIYGKGSGGQGSGGDVVRERPIGSLPPGTELIGVFSPVGRCGKTAFALTLGEVLGESRRTLYLDMERYSGLKNLGIVQEGAGDLNDLLYYHRIDADSLVYRLPSLVRTFRNLDYITPPMSGEDVMAVRAPEWIDLFATLAAAGEYEAIVLDLGISLEELLPVLSACTTIYMPVLDDQVSASKVEQFFQAAEQMGMGFIDRKTHRLHLPNVREELWGKDVSSRFARGKMGAYVRKLL